MKKETVCEICLSSMVGMAGQKRIVEKLWREFFSDPSQWWDHRSEKVSGYTLRAVVAILTVLLLAACCCSWLSVLILGSAQSSQANVNGVYGLHL
jgi:hypothetical protein